ncbi:MAG: hypothetical protein V3R69_00180, partial [candidate division NC10 bacterium]
MDVAITRDKRPRRKIWEAARRRRPEKRQRPHPLENQGPGATDTPLNLLPNPQTHKRAYPSR